MAHGPPLVPRAAEPSRALGRNRDAPRNEWQHLVSLQYHLRDTLAMLDHYRLHCGVAHDHAPFIRKVGVDGPRRVRDAEPFPECGAAAWTHLRLVSRRDSRLESQWNQGHCSRWKR